MDRTSQHAAQPGVGARDKIAAALREIRDEYLRPHDLPWIVAYSAGKDSTLLLQLVFEALLDIAPSDRRRVVHLVNNDTLVESPLLASHARASLEKIGRAAQSMGLPIEAHTTVPEEDQTFWVNVIGRGYMPPNRRFRWCTDRMKIRPTTEFVKSQVSAAGEVILLLGVRRSESTNRAATIDRHTVAGERLNPHDSLKSCLVFRPIVDFTTDEVWQTLLQRMPPWGGSHRSLITLYKNAQAGECPLVLDRGEAPACGSKSGRFGCWTCTVVERDRSGEAMADAGFDEYEHLLEFRDWLRDLQHDKTRRMPEKRSGKVTIVDGELLPGPFTFAARDEILQKLLTLQETVGREIISEREINLIKRTWAEDMVGLINRRFAWEQVAEECEDC